MCKKPNIRNPFVSGDVSRCNNVHCGLRLNCARFLQLKLDAKNDDLYYSVTRFGQQDGITSQCEELIPVVTSAPHLPTAD